MSQPLNQTRELEKSIYRQKTKNTTQKPSQTYTVNFLAAVGINTKSMLFIIKNLTEFEFGKILIKIKIELTEDPYAIKHLNYILSMYELSRKEITEILEEYEDPFSDFDGKIERSMMIYKKIILKVVVLSQRKNK